ncbi:hypothetical protein SAMN05216226_10715 [Halovenus aranensis]|uniref:Uncharacterized protein n=1 Tax=Halovenus aranensis TaxID=890420 RepID=A0A1G8VLX7_9EURY|nr:hypothetical protein [Halovenus aranensis]SDJ66934.1 hypothetical protein SAMN05216226_10715 [Halovenus aranensis]
MPSALVAAVRNRLSLRTTLLWAVTLAAVVAVTGDPAIVLGIATAMVASEALDVLVDVPGVDERWGKAAFGVVVTLASTVWLWTAASGAPVDAVLPVLAVATGLWLVLDARADFVRGRRATEPEGVEEMDSGEAMLVMQHIRLVAVELQSGPKTVSELATACDLTESRVREALDLASEDGTIYRVETEADELRYALDEEMLGASGVGRMVGGGLQTFTSRLLRPFSEQSRIDSKTEKSD